MKPLLKFSDLYEVKKILRKSGLKTVCEESRCPNMSECFGSRTATFMILGNRCTRSCSFCNVSRSSPLPPDPREPYRILEAVRKLGIKYVVLTSPTRDDLPDGGASHFARCVRVLKREGLEVEVLVPDLKGRKENLAVVLRERPKVLNHNLETVPRLYSAVRKGADYERSLNVLKWSKEIDPSVLTKSALILGFGEKREEVIRVMEDLRSVECDILVLGQYYQPSLGHHPVVKYYTEEEFLELEEIAKAMGFRYVVAKPNARSSYKALEAVL